MCVCVEGKEVGGSGEPVRSRRERIKVGCWLTRRGEGQRRRREEAGREDGRKWCVRQHLFRRGGGGGAATLHTKRSTETSTKVHEPSTRAPRCITASCWCPLREESKGRRPAKSAREKGDTAAVRGLAQPAHAPRSMPMKSRVLSAAGVNLEGRAPPLSHPLRQWYADASALVQSRVIVRRRRGEPRRMAGKRPQDVPCRADMKQEGKEEVHRTPSLYGRETATCTEE